MQLGSKRSVGCYCLAALECRLGIKTKRGGLHVGGKVAWFSFKG